MLLFAVVDHAEVVALEVEDLLALAANGDVELAQLDLHLLVGGDPRRHELGAPGGTPDRRRDNLDPVLDVVPADVGGRLERRAVQMGEDPTVDGENDLRDRFHSLDRRPDLDDAKGGLARHRAGDPHRDRRRRGQEHRCGEREKGKGVHHAPPPGCGMPATACWRAAAPVAATSLARAVQERSISATGRWL